MTNGGKINILLVDDQPENLIALGEVLEPLGQNVVKASSGREALQHVLGRDFAVILLDVQMPGMDGLECASLIRAREKTKYTPIIFLTAMHKSDAPVFKAYGMGAVDFIFKPVDVDILRSKVSVFIELARKTMALEEANVRLTEANRELDSFAHTVSHDLRAPLRHIAGFIGLFREKAEKKLSGEEKECLDTVTGAAKKMGQLIDDLLLFSRTTRAALTKTTVSTDRMVAEIIEEQKSEAKGRRIAWKTAPLPDVEGDPPLLKQVWINLVSNAVKYTGKRPEAAIEIGCRQGEENETVFFVRDNGAGFDMKNAHRLFGVFQRLHTEGEFSGTGVGLANVRKIVERHGGRCWAEGETDKGAAFYFALPKKEERP